jgi:putative phage-type endonuclease
MKILDLIQGSDEWKAARAGKVTASRVSDVLAKVKSGESASRRNLKAQIVAEILTGCPQDSTFTNAAMQWGTEQEPFARVAYELSTGLIVDQAGMVLHPTIDRAAASPDGLVCNGKGLVEIKCPNTATHLDYLLAGTVPKDYQPQMLWQMACTGAEFCDFVSYDPRLPEHLQLFVAQMVRDEDRIREMESEVLLFLAEVDSIISRLPQAA